MIKRKIQDCMVFLFLLTISFVLVSERDESYQPVIQQGNNIEEIHYRYDGIDARYPQFIDGAGIDQLAQWNGIIKTDFKKILSIYSFRPLPEPLPEPTGTSSAMLEVSNEIKMIQEPFFSVLYRAAFNSEFSAHPSESVYTTNIDLKNNKRLRLNDLIVLNEAFVRDFRKWGFIPYEKGNEELNQAIRDYLNSLSEEELLIAFQRADRIGSDNPWGVFSYLTPDRLGISISVPNYAGDHVEFEKRFSELAEFMKPALK